ncbi:hypothetical protein CC80DRAFT_476013 [Byssothecium circinans]|uniref:Thioesterase domain-containing protein n=1 Tax=Byssothecium circinans TaxID=147558 RepID=A0A6A5TNQ6_9PLEO|nr:hypothetical protein CC80DRAFT_476013 [Byssothecium circinans]
MTQLEVHPDFQSRPWCMAIIQSPSTESIPWPSRPAKAPADHSYSLFSRTLHTPSTIPSGYAMWEADPEGGKTGQALLLVSMGDDVNYYPNTLHGGIVAALIDEAMGLLVFRKMGWKTGIGSGTLTAKIDITLRGPVETPGVCLVRAWADDQEAQRQGKKWSEMRKLWALATIEDGDGRTLVEAKYMFIQPKKTGKL